MRNIVLIGMPASGKSVTGVVLAKALKMKYIDADLVIQEKSGRTLQEIIEEDGMEAFKALEEEILCGVNEVNAVIATGGSAVYYPNAIAHLKRNGIMIYLKADFETITKRLQNIKTRGVAMKKNQTLEQLYAVRKPLYEKYADITVNTGAEPLEATVKAIIDELQRESKKKCEIK